MSGTSPDTAESAQQMRNARVALPAKTAPSCVGRVCRLPPRRLTSDGNAPGLPTETEDGVMLDATLNARPNPSGRKTGTSAKYSLRKVTALPRRRSSGSRTERILTPATSRPTRMSGRTAAIHERSTGLGGRRDDLVQVAQERRSTLGGARPKKQLELPSTPRAQKATVVLTCDHDGRLLHHWLQCPT